MKNTIKTTALILSISFSIFCFCYLNAVNIAVATPTVDLDTAAEQLNTAEPKKSEVFFPDLQFVERTTQLASRILKVF